MAESPSEQKENTVGKGEIGEFSAIFIEYVDYS